MKYYTRIKPSCLGTIEEKKAQLKQISFNSDDRLVLVFEEKNQERETFTDEEILVLSPEETQKLIKFIRGLE